MSDQQHRGCRRRLAPWLLAGLAMLSLLPQASAKPPATTKAFFWQAEQGGRTISLLGSFHLATKDMYPLPPQVERAFHESHVLVLEARVDRVPATLQAEIIRRGMYMPPDGLPKHVSGRTWRLASAAASRLGLPVAAVRQMKPWMAATSISLFAVKAIGFDEQRGIERHFLAKIGTREVKELEGAMAQIQLLDGFTHKQQEAFLVYSVKQAKSIKGQMGSFVGAWKRGDHRAMDRLLTGSVGKTPGLRSMYRRLVTDRNRTMTATLLKMLKDTPSDRTQIFVVVGAAHMVGKQGMVALLRKRGLAFKQR